ncbi:NAD-dependent epimerase/dehydratase family protein [soil metagenome]
MTQIRHLITGGAGFIGVNLARELLARGDRVLVVDDLSRGRLETLGALTDHPDFRFQKADCCDAAAMVEAVRLTVGQVEEVWHLAANSDIPAGVEDPRIDLQRTFLTTFGVLQAMRILQAPVLHFASSSAICGDHVDPEIHEDIGPLEPISNYGAMKLASEAQIRAAVEAWLQRANILRFPNVIGAPATHGVILDLVHKLKSTPEQLDVLGDGTQRKAYLHVDDLILAMVHIRDLPGSWQVMNIGPSDRGVTVRFIAETVRDLFKPSAEIAFGQGGRGWVGDVPRFFYSTDRLKATGWSPRLSSSEAIERAVGEIIAQETR